MVKKNKLIKFCFSIIGFLVKWLANILLFFKLLNLKDDYIKISSFKKTRNQNVTVLLNALVAGEDHRFDLHIGFDPISVFRAFWKVYLNKAREGGSTIEQQLVRVITNRYEVTIYRKFREILLSTVLKNFFTKTEVMNTYLSVAYFGWHMNGIEQVFSRLNINENEITASQACFIIAMLKYPEPKIVSEDTIKKINMRAEHIYARLKEKECITNCYTLDREPGAAFIHRPYRVERG